MEDVWYIKLHRRIKENTLFQEKRTFSKFEAWIYILLSCNFEKWEFLLWYDILEIEAWSFVSSKVKLRKVFNWGEQKINNFFNLLEKKNMISQKTVWKSRDKATLISVINWGKYQIDQCTNQGSNQGTTKVRPRFDQGQYKKDKKNKKEKNNSIIDESIIEPSSEVIKTDKRDLDIDLIIETLKDVNWWIIDDKVKQQRVYWKNIKSKLNKLHWFNWDYSWFIRYCYENSDEYRKQHFKSAEKFYYNIAWIISWIKANIKTKPGTLSI